MSSVSGEGQAGNIKPSVSLGVNNEQNKTKTVDASKEEAIQEAIQDSVKSKLGSVGQNGEQHVVTTDLGAGVSPIVEQKIVEKQQTYLPVTQPQLGEKQYSQDLIVNKQTPPPPPPQSSKPKLGASKDRTAAFNGAPPPPPPQSSKPKLGAFVQDRAAALKTAPPVPQRKPVSDLSHISSGAFQERVSVLKKPPVLPPKPPQQGEVDSRGNKQPIKGAEDFKGKLGALQAALGDRIRVPGNRSVSGLRKQEVEEGDVGEPKVGQAFSYDMVGPFKTNGKSFLEQTKEEEKIQDLQGQIIRFDASSDELIVKSKAILEHKTIDYDVVAKEFSDVEVDSIMNKMVAAYNKQGEDVSEIKANINDARTTNTHKQVILEFALETVLSDTLRGPQEGAVFETDLEMHEFDLQESKMENRLLNQALKELNDSKKAEFVCIDLIAGRFKVDGDGGSTISKSEFELRSNEMKVLIGAAKEYSSRITVLKSNLEKQAKILEKQYKSFFGKVRSFFTRSSLAVTREKLQAKGILVSEGDLRDTETVLEAAKVAIASCGNLSTQEVVSAGNLENMKDIVNRLKVQYRTLGGIAEDIQEGKATTAQDAANFLQNNV